MKTHRSKDGWTLPALALVGLAGTGGAWAEAIKVEVASDGNRHQLMRGGTPYLVKGAGAGGVDFATLAERGGNSVRTWGIDMAQTKLDAAHRHGLTVSMGLPVGAERFGFDYGDEVAVNAQRRSVQAAVRRYRKHPALLLWIIGNELDHGAADLAVYDEVNALSGLIRKLDPNHPTTTTVTGAAIDNLDEIARRTPAVDFLSLQLYGALAVLSDYAEKLDGKPFMVTEWGPLGHWEVGRTSWDAPVEQDSAEKGRYYLMGYQRWIAPLLDQGLGSYVFLWGQKQERTPTWYSMFTESGEATATLDAMQQAWTGEWPANRAPTLKSMHLDGKTKHENATLRPGLRYPASVQVEDAENDAVTYRWRIKPESKATAEGGDREAPIPDLEGLIENPFGRRTVLTAPKTLGAYRLFVTAYDGAGNAAYANIPFRVAHRPRR